MFKKSRLSSAILAASTLLLVHESTVAQEIEEVTVMGIKGSLQRGMDTKREAGGVVDSISAEGIGKFPDANIAESLQRITGVSIDRSGGEGQSITVRGFGPEFNTVLVNGRQIASESQTRGFSFDTVASELVSGLDVYKTANAAFQSGGIGSTVNIRTARPFDSMGLKLAGSLKATYEENSEETSPQISGLISNTFADDKFGVLLAVSHQERDARVDSARTDGWLENVGIPQSELNGGAGAAGNIFSPRNFDLRVATEDRTRTNANLVLQFQATDEIEVTLDYLYSDFDIENETTSYGHWFTAPNIENAITDANGTVVDLYQEVGLATDFHAKKFDRLTETDDLGLNVKWNVNESFSLSFDVHRSTAERAANNGGGDQLSLIGYANRVRFQSDNSTLPWASEFQAANPDIYSGQQELDGVAYDPAVTPQGVSDYLDPANGRAHVMLRRGWAVEDEVDQYKVDGVWDEGNDTGVVKAKFGLAFSSETKDLTRWDNEGVGIHCTFCGYPDSPDIPDDFLSVFDAGSDFLEEVSGSGRTPAVWLAHDGEQQFGFLEGVSGLSFDAIRRNNSFSVEEETTSAYLELEMAGEIAGMRLSAVTGARYESTDVTVSGTEEPIEQLNILDATEMLAAFGTASSIAADTDYSILLPSLNVRLDITEELTARFGASRTLTRPTLDSMAPVTNIGTTRQGGNLTATSGNPALVPFKADNLDLSLEWYYGEVSYVSLGYFQKNVSNFIVNTTEDRTFVVSDGSLLTDPSTGTDVSAPDAADEVAVFTVTLPNNGESAEVTGWEFAVQHNFGETGFGVIFNATIVDSDSDLDPADVTQKFAVTGLSDSLNLVGYYEKGPFQARLAFNQRDKFLQSLTQTNGDGVVFVDDYEQLDFSTSYDITDNLTVFFEAINLTEEVVTKHGRFANQFLDAEDAGRRFSAGIRGSF
ncbi:MAG: TonB-dependent receptor [Gammaproteobacteria bacterium]|nr:TonB-dependent receptor [Gammaproteobacteria bacterium]